MNYTITLSEQEINLVGAALGKLPFEAVASLVAKLQQQVNDQQKVDEAPVAKVKK